MSFAARSALAALAMAGVVVAAGACARSEIDEGDSSLLGGDVPCEVSRILVSKCQQCHATMPRFGAPMALVTRSDLLAPAKSDASQRVVDLVVARVHDDVHPMPQPPNPRLSAAAVSTLEAWRSGGAPPQHEPSVRDRAADQRCGQQLRARRANRARAPVGDAGRARRVRLLRRRRAAGE